MTIMQQSSKAQDRTLGMKPSKDDPDAFEKLESYTSIKESLKQEINTLRERVAHFNLAYLSLPSNTPKDVALQVFINMNTNSKPLYIEYVNKFGTNPGEPGFKICYNDSGGFKI